VGNDILKNWPVEVHGYFDAGLVHDTENAFRLGGVASLGASFAVWEAGSVAGEAHVASRILRWYQATGGQAKLWRPTKGFDIPILSRRERQSASGSFPVRHASMSTQEMSVS
jgi:hypothetical protein